MTPTQTSMLEVSRRKNSPKDKVAGRGPRNMRQTRRVGVISPRTRGNAIASILASPGEFATENTGTKNIFVSPSKRSSAEATLHYLARVKNGNKRSLDTANGVANNLSTVQRKRRSRKAASVAYDKVRDICRMDDFDDLNDLSETDKIPYKKANPGKKKTVSDLVVSETIQSVYSSSNDDRPRVTVDTFIPKGKIEERWFRNLKKWISSKDDLTSESSSTFSSSPLPKRWAQDQRAQHRLLQQSKKSQMTQDRIDLLESAGMRWEVRNRKCTTTNGPEKGQSKEMDNKTARSSATNASVAIRNEGDQKSKSQAKFKPTSESAKETDTSINDSPSKRKSPRKSLPTQFYHNRTSSSDKVKDSGVGKTASNTSKESKSNDEKQLQTIGPKASAPTSTISSDEKQLLAPNESLASLSADASAKNKADIQKQGRKKKRRGRRSTSSLTALGVQMETSIEESKSDSSKKGSSSFSHKELKQELSKSKKKPPRKKSDIGAAKKNTAKNPKSKASNDSANKNAGDNGVSSTAKKSTSTDSKLEHEYSDGKVAKKRRE
mmetsp:Transcript_682/g.1396  ORF Transcript_682/g.1396 Transcript_682/m.1396 type:complete len:550 (+) Transcript_682:29-1678(+)